MYLVEIWASSHVAGFRLSCTAERPKSPPIPTEPGGIGHQAKCALQKTLDFLGTFVVNSGMKEYENSCRWRPPVPIPALDCTDTCAAAPAFPPKIGFIFNSSHTRKPSENTDILIAWLIANGNHSQKSPSDLKSAGYNFLIASISCVFECLFSRRIFREKHEAPIEGIGAQKTHSQSAPTKENSKSPHVKPTCWAPAGEFKIPTRNSDVLGTRGRIQKPHPFRMRKDGAPWLGAAGFCCA